MQKLTALFLASLLLILPSCGTETTIEDSSITEETSITNSNSESMTAEELIIEDITVGDGDEAVAGQLVSVHYTGTLTDGTKFDSSKDRGIPFEFTLGAGQVIEGWDKGVAGMKVGGTRTLTIPSDMAYGASGIPGVIPGGATLLFEVELLAVE